MCLYAKHGAVLLSHLSEPCSVGSKGNTGKITKSKLTNYHVISETACRPNKSNNAVHAKLCELH